MLGIKLLVAAFDAHDDAREGLLREVQSKLVGVKEEVALPFVAVLSLWVHKHPKAVLQHAPLLKVRQLLVLCMLRTLTTCTAAINIVWVALQMIWHLHVL